MPRSSPALLTLAFMASLVVPDTRAMAAEGDRTYVYDPANPGWAYCCDPEAEENWIRLDLGSIGLAGPPDDALGRPIYVIAPGSSEYAYSGSADLESNWVSLEGWREPTSAGAGSNVGSPTLTPTILPAASAVRPPSPTPTTAAVANPSPPVGTYELGVSDRVARSAGCCKVWGMHFPLSFPESWRGRMMRVRIENVQWQPRNIYPPLDPGVPPGEYSPSSSASAWEINLYWTPRQLSAGEEFLGSDSCSEPRAPVPCVLPTGGVGITSMEWAVQPGRYFLFFRDHDTRYQERRVLSVRFRLDYLG